MSHSPTITEDAPLRPRPVEQALVTIQKFIHSQVTGSAVLLVCSLLALLWANSPWSDSYFHLWETELAITLGGESLAFSLHEWVNEGLMMLFFLLVGLEIKREVLVGELSSLRQAVLPIVAALGGMVVPALIFFAFNAGTETVSGWGIPMATDIAFALGLLSLLGRRVPLSLKVFLTALAVADDLGAITVIAVFYSGDIALNGLLVAGAFWLGLFVLSRISVYNPIIYLILAVGVWLGFMMSGVHATIAGVMVAVAIPSRSLIAPRHFLRASSDKVQELQTARLHRRSVLQNEEQKVAVTTLRQVSSEMHPPLLQLENGLHPWVTFAVLPLFALANAGVVLGGNTDLVTSISLGVALGLVLGKQIGITLFAWLAVKSGLARLPRGLSWAHIYGVAWLAGLGFTVSLFVSELAYTDRQLIDQAKLGILGGSIIAAVVGLALLRLWTGGSSREEPAFEEEQIREAV